LNLDIQPKTYCFWWQAIACCNFWWMENGHRTDTRYFSWCRIFLCRYFNMQ